MRELFNPEFSAIFNSESSSFQDGNTKVTTVTDVLLQDWVCEQLRVVITRATGMLDFIHLRYPAYIVVIHTVVAAKRCIARQQHLVHGYFEHGLITEHVREGIVRLLAKRHQEIKVFHHSILA